MSFPLLDGARTSRSGFLTALLGASLALGACQDAEKTVGPRIPGTPPQNPQVRAAAFILDVNSRNGTVRITPAGQSLDALSPSLSVSGGDIPGIALPNRPNLSILAGDVVQLTTSNFSASAVGAFQPGKVRVRFDVNVTNRLGSVELITPTFPVPPAGVAGVLLFPYEINVTETSGGTSVGGDGTEVIVELPSYGLVESSIDWNGTGATGSGTPHNFFNDAACAAGATDCFRWEAFGQPLAAGGTSEARTVGFDIDPTVGNFRARLIVAADLRNSGAAPTGTINGGVTSPQRGALSGVLVTVTSGGFTGTSDGAGSFSIAGVTTGPKSVSVSNLPAGCTAPAAQNVTVSSGSVTTVTFSVTCTELVGSVVGTVTSSLGGGIQGASVIVTPASAPARPAVSSSSSGGYSVANVPVGSGSIALSNLPANCTNPGPGSYSGLAAGGSVTVDFTVACSPPPQGYAWTYEWASISATQVRLRVFIDMSTFNSPSINGAGPDDIYAVQTQLFYDASKLAYASGANCPAGTGAGNALQNITAGNPSAGRVNWLNFSTAATPPVGRECLAEFVFTRQAGATGSVSTTTLALSSSEFVIADRTESDLKPNTLISEATFVLP